MSDIAICAENLGKRYRIGALQKTGLRDDRRFVDFLLSPFAYMREMLRPPRPDEIFWALQDVSFEIKHGEVVGFIGRNGAGKSTLLKLLARITEPTTGRADIYGKVSALLEVGTGFHPDLTGRENVYVNGAILGMSRREIDSRFDEIVSFAEVEQFIDTPVKRYSSGMQVRLAFSVSAHLTSDILIVDEVLAVGDTAFQRKCLSKMDNVARAGKTVLFVSHSMPTITRLCSRAFLLDRGRIVDAGTPSDIVTSYLKIGMHGSPYRQWPDLAAAPGNHIVRLRSVKVIDPNNEAKDILDIRRPVGVEMIYVVLEDGAVLWPQVRFFSAENICLFMSIDYDETPRKPGTYKSTVWVPGNFFAEGKFYINVYVTKGGTSQINETEVAMFQIMDPAEGDSARGIYSSDFPGVVRPKLDWKKDFLEPL